MMTSHWPSEACIVASSQGTFSIFGWVQAGSNLVISHRHHCSWARPLSARRDWQWPLEVGRPRLVPIGSAFTAVAVDAGSAETHRALTCTVNA